MFVFMLGRARKWDESSIELTEVGPAKPPVDV